MKLRLNFLFVALLSAMATLPTPNPSFGQTRSLEMARQAWERHMQARDYQSALPHARQLLADARTRYKAGSSELAFALYRVADIVHYLDKRDEAGQLYDEALKNARLAKPADPELLAMVLSAYGDLLRLRGQHLQGERLLLEAIRHYESFTPPDHQGLANALNNLAVCQKALARFSEAERSYKKAISLLVSTEGPQSSQLINIYLNLARLLEDEGKPNDALEQIERAISLLKGQNDPHTIGLAHRYAGRILATLGDIDQAVARLETALMFMERSVGRDAPLYLATWNELIDVKQQKLTPREKIDLLEKQIREARSRYGTSSYQASNLQFQLSFAYQLANDKIKAIEILSELKARYDRSNSINLSAQMARHMGELYLNDRKYDAALLHLTEAASSYMQAGRDYEIHAAQTLERLSVTLSRLGKHEQALATVRKGIKVISDSGLYQDRSVAGTLINLANGLPDFDPQKLEIYQTAAARIVGMDGVSGGPALNVLQGYASLLMKWARHTEAISIYEKLAAAGIAENSDLRGAATFYSNILAVALDGSQPDLAEKYAGILIEFSSRENAKDILDTSTALALVRYLISAKRTTEAERFLAQAKALATHEFLHKYIKSAQGTLDLANKKFDQALNNFLELSREDAGRWYLLDVEIATAYFGIGDYAAAHRYASKVAERIIQNIGYGSERLPPSEIVARAKQSRMSLGIVIKSLHELAMKSESDRQRLTEQAFEAAQWRALSLTSATLSQLSTRVASGSNELGMKVRRLQDKLAIKRSLERKLTDALQDFRSARENDSIRQIEHDIDRERREIDQAEAEIASDHKEFVEVGKPRVLSIKDVQPLLRATQGPEEALVVVHEVDDETYVWAITSTKALWFKSTLNSQELAQRVQILRCGLDEEQWTAPERSAACSKWLGLGAMPGKSSPLPFHAGVAHEIYDSLFGAAADLIKDKHLLAVLSGPLSTLPLHVLVVDKPGTDAPRTFEGFRDIAWLGKRNAIAVLPAVSNIQTLREHLIAGSKAPLDYIGFGNPVLKGTGGSCPTAQVPEECPRPIVTAAREQRAATRASRRAATVGYSARRSTGINSIFQSGAGTPSLAERLQSLCPLPDTAYEIRCVSQQFGQASRAIYLGAAATEARVKSLSNDGTLAKYRVLHFATHGLVAGEVGDLATRQGEPALVMTPADQGANGDDDGLLTASEVAQLNLNAEWVVLSACNTAASDGQGAEALSGLARAFFYARARALLVSHWPVYSDAAVRLTTRTFAELGRDNSVSRSEALRRAMTELMDDQSQPDNAHPSIWAPFILVGDGRT